MADIMVRYDDLRRYCEKRHCGSVPLEYIKQMPTIEAEPVRRGEWIQIGGKTMKCSVCGWYQSAKRTETVKSGCFAKAYHFCTACGARMDGGADK
jgi:hypothetical protein